ncbi:hypothetical protein Axy14_005 [Achromobacter phage vB_AxyS_19-32_Axy14]|nr:hypothetical protein Axy14_005 [Achromobacter phage vB_AxyS_19-32_Axy14]
MKVQYGSVQSEVTGYMTHGAFVLHEGTCVTNPNFSECGRFPVNPTEYYGLSQMDADLVTEYNERRGVTHGCKVTEESLLAVAICYVEEVSKTLPDATKEYCHKWLRDTYCIAEFRNELILNDFHDVEHLCALLQFIMAECDEE